MALPSSSTSTTIPLCTAPPSTSTTLYHLLELPDEIASLIERSPSDRTGEKKRKSDEVGDVAETSKKTCLPQTRLTIKGRRDDNAVLTTSDKTYSLRTVSQSNSLLLFSLESNGSPLIPNRKREEGVTIQGRAASSAAGGVSNEYACRLDLKSNITDTLELVLIPPRLERLAELLRPSVYLGEEEEEEQTSKRLYTLREIRSVVQASDEELEKGFHDHRVMELDGYCRQVSEAQLSCILKATLNHMDLHSYLPGKVPRESSLLSISKEYDLRYEVVRETLCSWFGSDRSEESEEGKVIELKMDKIIRFTGLEVLRKVATSQAVPLAEFYRCWREELGQVQVPRGNLDVRVLKGEYLVHPSPLEETYRSIVHRSLLPLRSKSSSSKRPPPSTPRLDLLQEELKIRSQPRSNLPLDPMERLRTLFSWRSKWSLEEISPFLEDLTSANAKSRDAMLLKWSRVSKVKVERILLDQELLRETEEEDQAGKDRWREDEVLVDVNVYSARVK